MVPWFLENWVKAVLPPTEVRKTGGRAVFPGRGEGSIQWVVDVLETRKGSRMFLPERMRTSGADERAYGERGHSGICKNTLMERASRGQGVRWMLLEKGRLDRSGKAERLCARGAKSERVREGSESNSVDGCVDRNALGTKGASAELPDPRGGSSEGPRTCGERMNCEALGVRAGGTGAIVVPVWSLTHV